MSRAAGFDRPIFIVSSPRSGSSLLFQTLARAPGVATIGGESHGLIESIRGLHPRERGWSSNRLTSADASDGVVTELGRRFQLALRTREGQAPNGPVRMIEKTPKNALRIPFLDTAFGEAHFLYLYRDPRETLSSMIEAWQSGGFRTYPALPGWTTVPWSLLLVPGWRDLAKLDLAEIVARQWARTTTILLDDLALLPSGRVRSVAHSDVIATPQHTITGLCDALDLAWDVTLGNALPLSPTVVSAPRPDKWRRNERAIEAVWPIVAEADARARAALSFYGG